MIRYSLSPLLQRFFAAWIPRTVELVIGKVELVSGKVVARAEDAVVAYDCLNLATERLTLDPIRHIACTKSQSSDL